MSSIWPMSASDESISASAFPERPSCLLHKRCRLASSKAFSDRPSALHSAKLHHAMSLQARALLTINEEHVSSMMNGVFLSHGWMMGGNFEPLPNPWQGRRTIRKLRLGGDISPAPPMIFDRRLSREESCTEQFLISRGQAVHIDGWRTVPVDRRNRSGTLLYLQHSVLSEDCTRMALSHPR